MNDRDANAPEGRTIRVFISSTFQDMGAERDELVKQAFPELRKLCEERAVTWGEVDLRWGITDEQRAEGQVLPVCLAEIKRCRPYFIGILGERYGWDGIDVPPQLTSVEPWLVEHVQTRKSITELEILHGVLNEPSMSGQAFFYFRDPAYARPRGMIEVPTDQDIRDLGLVEAEARAETRRAKLAALKQRIRDAHRDGKLAHAPREGFATPAALAEMVKQDLRLIIDTRFPEQSEPDPLAREAARHEAFGTSRAQIYIARPELYASLDSFVAGHGLPLVVLGESGSGKSALLANWVRRLRAMVSRTQPAVAPLVIEHFFGATPASTDCAAMVRRILGEISRHFDLSLEIPDRPEMLQAAFADSLSRAAAEGTVVLVLDGLNQLEGRDQAPALAWLPSALPPNVRLLLSTLPGPSFEALKQRGWPTLNVNPLSIAERRELISTYLKRKYGRELSPARMDLVSTAPQVANPLYLLTLLEELRQWGDNATLGERIAHYLSAASPRGLFIKVLERWEQDFEHERPGLVRDAMSALWVARWGLSEAELVDILGHPERLGEPLPMAIWSPFHLGADASLIDRSGLLGFAHDYLRQAVAARYLSTVDGQRRAHVDLADYFEPRRLADRMIGELPWQFSQAQEWKRLKECLENIPFLAEAFLRDRYEVLEYWKRIEDGSTLTMRRSLERVVRNPAYFGFYLFPLAQLLELKGFASEALGLLDVLEQEERQVGRVKNLASVLQLKGQIEVGRNPARALAMHREQASLWQRNDREMASALTGQAVALTGVDDAAAFSLLARAESIYRSAEDRNGLQQVLGLRAGFLAATQRLDEALALLEEQAAISREIGNVEGLLAAMNGQAGMYTQRDPEKALLLAREQESIARRHDLKRWVEAALLTRSAIVLRQPGNEEAGLRMLEEADGIAQARGDIPGHVMCTIGRATILIATGRRDDAEALLVEAHQLAQRHNFHAMTQKLEQLLRSLN